MGPAGGNPARRRRPSADHRALQPRRGQDVGRRLLCSLVGVLPPAVPGVDHRAHRPAGRGPAVGGDQPAVARRQRIPSRPAGPLPAHPAGRLARADGGGPVHPRAGEVRRLALRAPAGDRRRGFGTAGLALRGHPGHPHRRALPPAPHRQSYPHPRRLLRKPPPSRLGQVEDQRHGHAELRGGGGKVFGVGGSVFGRSDR